MAYILVIDDEANICRSFQTYFEELGHRVSVAPSGERGLEIFDSANRPDAVILDIRLPGKSGLDVLSELKRRAREVPVIIITGHGTMDTAVSAMSRGAFDYLTKPIDLSEARVIIEKALKSLFASREAAPVGAAASREVDTGILAGHTPPMQELYKRIGAVAPSDASVLIVGESGVGKELVARAIHENSPRKGKPFEPVQCAALPATLLESEIYGYEKGAFTGAQTSKPGKFAVADGGTIFLDEVGELAPEMQVKLLRFLQEKIIEPLGTTKKIRLDVRVMAATNAPLAQRIATGRFREDLYFRLAVVTINVPALRERRDDIPLLCERFLEECGQPGERISPDAAAALKAYHWPGNVRELRNAIEHAAIITRGAPVMREHLPETVLAGGMRPETAAETLEKLARDVASGMISFEEAAAMWEKPLIRAALEKAQWNRSRAAELLKINRATLRKKMKKYGLE